MYASTQCTNRNHHGSFLENNTIWILSLIPYQTYSEVDGCDETDLTSSLHIVHETVGWGSTDRKRKRDGGRAGGGKEGERREIEEECEGKGVNGGREHRHVIPKPNDPQNVCTYITELNDRVPELVYLLFFLMSGLMRSSCDTRPPLCRIIEW